jgi:SAM-dependent methyltransferase
MDAAERKPTALNFAEKYEATLVPVIFQPWAHELIRRAMPVDGEHILDLACGTGAVSLEIAGAGVSPGSLTGVDISPDMLAVARSKAEAVGLTSEWLVADAAHLPFPDASFDLAFCQQALQFFPDRPAALGELRRILKPGGRVAFCVQRELSLNPLLQSQAATLEKYAGPEAAVAVRAICGLPDAESVTLTLTHPDGKAFAEGAMGGMHTGDKLSQLSDAERAQCIGDFLTGLGECFDGTALRFPHVSNVISARA